MDRLGEFLDDARTTVEGLASDRLTVESLARGEECAASLQERGILMRALYPESVLQDARVLDSLHRMSALGARARTLPTIPVRMVLADRRQGLVAVEPEAPEEGMVIARSAGVVAALSALFDVLWAQGEELTGAPRADEDGVLTATERELLRLLLAGNTDDGAARQLEVSSRTIRRMLADLCGRTGARSRFELAAQAMHRGWLRLA